MKKFVWRLQRVLDVKIKEEQLRKAELLKIADKISATREQILKQRNILSKMIDSLSRENPKDRLAKQEIFMLSSIKNNEIIKHLEITEKELELQHKKKMLELLTVRQFKESMGKLREEAKKQFIKKEEKDEQKIMDDITTYKFAQNIINQNNGLVAKLN